MAVQDPDVELDGFVLVSAKDRTKRFDVSEAITTVDLERTIEGDFTLSVDCADPEKVILRHPLFDQNADGTLDPIDAKVDDVWFRLVAVARQGTSTTLTFEYRSITYLKQHRKKLKVSRNKLTRAEFILRLVNEVKATDIPFYSPELHKKQPIESPEQAAAHEKRKPSPKGKGTSLGKFVSTAYGPPWNSLQGTGVTSGGTDLRDGKRRYIVAADPKVLSLGTHVYIDPNPYDYDGTFLVDDTGGAIKGKRIDFFVVEGRKEQTAWGRKEVRVAQADKAEKGQVHKTIDKQFAFERGTSDDTKTSWIAIQKLAADVNWRFFFDDNTAVYMSEADLFRSAPIANITTDDPSITSVDWDWDVDVANSEMTVSVFARRWSFPPGSVVTVTGEGAADGRWLVAGNRRSLFDTNTELTLRKPQPERPEPAHETSEQTQDGGDGKVSTSGGAKGIVDDAVSIAKDAGGSSVYVGSALRLGAKTTSGNLSDHSANNSSRAARDIGVRGIDLITGPPSPKLDKAVVAIGKAFGRDYKSGNSGPFQNADTFTWKGYRIQIIWRTPQFGGHMGHIHVGAHKVSDSALSSPSLAARHPIRRDA